MRFLNRNPAVRARIKAAPGKTLIYAGVWKLSAWREIDRMKEMDDPRFESKQTLHDVLRRIGLAGWPPRNLLSYVQEVEKLVPKKPDQFILWRALSGIYAANAEPPISFLIGGDITTDKVFAVTELPVLLRNPKVASDADTRDILEYCQKCIRDKRTEIVVPYMAD
jgi:hypothetical protein